MRFLQIVTATGPGAARTPEHRATMAKRIGDAVASGQLLATGGLAKRATGAVRVQCKGGEITVEDPPSGEGGWMAAGGYSVIEAASKDAAVAYAKGTLEIMGDGMVELIAVSEMVPPVVRAPQSGGQAGPSSGVIAYLNIEGAAAAAEFYAKAFGAREVAKMPAEDGKRLMHCQLEINGGAFMLADVFPEMGVTAQPLGGVTLQLIVAGVDAWWKRALEAGCKVKMPLELAFWGDKYGQLIDPFGVTWAMSEPGQQPPAQK